MMRYNLLPHHDFLPNEVSGVGVDLTMGDGGDMLLQYRVVGAGRMITPARQVPRRTDNLWRTTCFELFLMFDDDERYVEFNFSPSTQWAAYAFSGYREGMANLPRDAPPRIERVADGVDVGLNLGGLPPGELRMALTAVIEEEGGLKSYWSLAHPPGGPDFHHPACFAARLPAPSAA